MKSDYLLAIGIFVGIFVGGFLIILPFEEKYTWELAGGSTQKVIHLTPAQLGAMTALIVAACVVWGLFISFLIIGHLFFTDPKAVPRKKRR